MRVFCTCALSLVVHALSPLLVHAQADRTERDGNAPGGTPSTETVTCASTAGQRAHCPARTSAGVALVQTTGPGECLLGRTWGYDQTGVWVSDGCGGVFATGQPQGVSRPPDSAQPEPRKPTGRIETWGEFDPGEGFLIGRSSAGELALSAYALLRYVNQTPGTQTFTDHLGGERTMDGRNDVFPHRVIVYLKGWLANPKLIYTVFF